MDYLQNGWNFSIFHIFNKKMLGNFCNVKKPLGNWFIQIDFLVYSDL